MIMNAMCTSDLCNYSSYKIKSIVSDELDSSEKPGDIDAKMYSPFPCVDCGQEFESESYSLSVFKYYV